MTHEFVKLKVEPSPNLARHLDSQSKPSQGLPPQWSKLGPQLDEFSLLRGSALGFTYRETHPINITPQNWGAQKQTCTCINHQQGKTLIRWPYNKCISSLNFKFFNFNKKKVVQYLSVNWFNCFILNISCFENCKYSKISQNILYFHSRNIFFL